MEEGKRKKGSRKKISLSQTVKSLDQFGQEFRMKLPEGASSLQSLTGSVFSILLLVLISAYAFQKYIVLIDRKDTYVMEAEEVNVYDYAYKFTEDEHQLAFAAGLSSYL